MLSTTEIMKRISSLDISAEAFRVFMSIVVELQSEGDERRRKDRERKRAKKVTVKTAEDPKPVLANSAELSAEKRAEQSPLARAFSMGEVRYTLEADASKGANAPSEDLFPVIPVGETLTPDKVLYRRAREIAGERAAAFVTKLKAQNGGDIGQTRQMVEQAALADDPLKYLVGMVNRGLRKANISQPAQSRREAPMTPRSQALADLYAEYSEAPDLSHRDAAGAFAPRDGGRAVGGFGGAG